MKTYEIKATDLVEYTITIEAESEEEALKKFREESHFLHSVHEHDRYWYDGGETAEEVSK